MVPYGVIWCHGSLIDVLYKQGSTTEYIFPLQGLDDICTIMEAKNQKAVDLSESLKKSNIHLHPNKKYDRFSKWMFDSNICTQTSTFTFILEYVSMI